MLNLVERKKDEGRFFMYWLLEVLEYCESIGWRMLRKEKKEG